MGTVWGPWKWRESVCTGHRYVQTKDELCILSIHVLLIVPVLKTIGLAAGHSDLTSSKLSGYSGNEAVTPWDRDQSGHGTHVTGTIAAADNSRGVVGVAPDVEIYTVRVFDNRGFFFGSDVVAAAEACRDAGVDIISMSLGGPSYDQDELEIFEELYEQGIISIAASGNSGDTDYSFPASYEVVISVAAVNSNRNIASFSTRNNRVDVAAPGKAFAHPSLQKRTGWY